jgi:MFS family permease
MTTQPAPRAAFVAVFAGLAALASAMGIGRFAFTPMLPLMQAGGALTLAEGAWLAFANYLGYLAGALLCSWRAPAPTRAVRFGLLAVALLTLGMGLAHGMAAWLLLRFGAGIASAFVLVGVAAAVLGTLAEQGRPAWAGWVFAGVGLGICAAGLLGLGAGLAGLAPEAAWLLLGGLSAVAAGGAWRALRPAPAVTAAACAAAPAPRALGREGGRLVVVYGGFGFGYIVPATFLPAAARELVADPAVFGWVWPVFGVAAAASTVLVAFVFRGTPPRRVWAVAQAVMALGVLATALRAELATLLLCAVCVGGTFVVATMAGLQEARRLAGPAAARWIAAMTAAFAAGQLLGPFAVGLLASTTRGNGMAAASGLAGVVLLVGAVALWRPAVADLPDRIERTST